MAARQAFMLSMLDECLTFVLHIFDSIRIVMWRFPIIRRPHNKDYYSILRSVLGSPYLGKLPCRAFAPPKP